MPLFAFDNLTNIAAWLHDYLRPSTGWFDESLDDPVASAASPPPPRNVTALAMVAILAWPADQGPQLTKPNDQPTKIAPLTLATGDQPARRPAISVAQLNAINAWPPDLEPRLTAPNERQQKIAPLTLGSGAAAPLPAPFLTPVEIREIVDAWTPDPPAAQGPIRSTAWSAPIQAQPAYAPLPRAIRDAWEPPDQPPPAQVKIAPLTLPTGSQPIPQAPLSAFELAQVVASWPSDVGPQLPAQRQQSIVTSQPAVSQPMPRGPLSFQALTTIMASWAQTWDAQRAAPNAAWNVPPQLISLPYTPLPRHLWTAWEPPFIAPPPPVDGVTLTLPTGNQPPPPLRDRQVAAAAAWSIDVPVQSSPKSTAWNVTATQVAYAPLPLSIRAAWEPAPELLQPRVKIAPLTLTYGQQPAPRAPLPVALLLRTVASWAVDWSAQRGAVDPPASFIPNPQRAQEVSANGWASNTATAVGYLSAVVTATGWEAD